MFHLTAFIDNNMSLKITQVTKDKVTNQVSRAPSLGDDPSTIT